jgi:hypothetical protein
LIILLTINVIAEDEPLAVTEDSSATVPVAAGNIAVLVPARVTDPLVDPIRAVEWDFTSAAKSLKVVWLDSDTASKKRRLRVILTSPH